MTRLVGFFQEAVGGWLSEVGSRVFGVQPRSGCLSAAAGFVRAPPGVSLERVGLR